MDELAAISKRQKAKDARSRIAIGDQVSVYFEHVERLAGTVLYMPNVPGDVWVIEDAGGHELHYIQAFARITKDIS